MTIPSWKRLAGELPSAYRTNLCIREREVIAHVLLVQYGEITAELNRLLAAGLLSKRLVENRELAIDEVVKCIAAIREIFRTHSEGTERPSKDETAD